MQSAEPKMARNKRELTLLKGMFERFQEASQRLEIRYESLKREAEELRQRLEQKEKEIKRAEKLSTLGETAAALAHEVRNPLASIKLFTSLIKRECQNPKEVKKIVEQIDISVANLESVVSNILLFSKDTARAFSIVNVQSIVGELCQGLTQIHPQLTFLLDLKGSPFVQGNDYALRQVFHNLLLNAAQATNFKGEITITSQESDPSGRVAGDLTIHVRDNGPGIPEELLPRVFEPFVTSKSEGTGLGLAIVRKIINEHCGGIEAFNAEGKGGAIFQIVLPQVQSVRGSK